METINSEKRHFPLYLKERIATYLVTCVFLGILNIVVTPHEWWIFWVALGWGMNLIKRFFFGIIQKERKKKDDAYGMLVGRKFNFETLKTIRT